MTWAPWSAAQTMPWASAAVVTWLPGATRTGRILAAGARPIIPLPGAGPPVPAMMPAMAVPCESPDVSERPSAPSPSRLVPARTRPVRSGGDWRRRRCR